ncbi:Activated RNA polymerase II transcriptional coactivator p15 [Hypsizygus marmoreus]|uniref:Activated RNA polymerase II transcriptional coactivator p15 n=1 Tax=Hypsizygus marmoreus TaxID=39966 RepID=A0A369JBK3_HYPMA|nr:Activated RNA polymerase II transcriptional coactivator p15 [Hypsizygus marmoreus]
MARKVVSSDEEDQLANDNSEYEESEAEEQTRKPTTKERPSRNQKRKAPKEDSESEPEAPLVSVANDKPSRSKKPKTEESDIAKLGLGKEMLKSASDSVIVKSTSDGEKYLELGKKKRATVRSFKGMPLLDIREFYGADGDEKPGKKGISLTLEQWEALKNSSSTIDDLFAALKKK